jgi:hypothetical protein
MQRLLRRFVKQKNGFDNPVIQELQEWYKLKDLLTRQQNQLKN